MCFVSHLFLLHRTVAILTAPNAAAANGYGGISSSGGSATAAYRQPAKK